jgi:hypothetical protein
MTNIACRLQHSVEAEVSCSFAWAWRTNVANWDDPPAQFELHGGFVSGSWGTTKMPGQEPIRWRLREVRPEQSFVIDMSLDGAILSFEWVFEPMALHRTRISQRIILSGDKATAYADQVRAGFGSTLDAGMRRIAAALVSAACSKNVADR